MGARTGWHLCALGCARKLKLLHCPFPSAITHFPALEFVFSSSQHVNYFTGQQSLVRASGAVSGLSAPTPFPWQQQHSQGRKLHYGHAQLERCSLPEMGLLFGFCCFALPCSLFFPPPFFPKFASQQNSQSGQSWVPLAEQ